MSNSRISNGLNLARSSMTVLNQNRQLLLFPLLSTAALVILIGSFALIAITGERYSILDAASDGSFAAYLVIFIFYLINYGIVVFFNMALVHCTRMHFHGQSPTVADGLRFSLSRIGVIFSWAVLSATVGLLLNIVEDVLGRVGQIISGLLGIAWSVTTFFVVPVLAYENLGPLAAVRRSADIMKKKWGESLAAGFSFGLLQFLAFVVCAIPVAILVNYDQETAAIITAVALFGFVVMVFSAARVIVSAAVYEKMSDTPIPVFDNGALDGLFISK